MSMLISHVGHDFSHCLGLDEEGIHGFSLLHCTVGGKRNDRHLLIVSDERREQKRERL